MWIKVVLGLILAIQGCNSSSWTKHDFSIISKKIHKVYEDWAAEATKEYLALHPEAKYNVETDATARKALRLGFHDCLTYQDGAPGQVNGCDGCLNPQGMNTNIVKLPRNKRPEMVQTSNDGLMFIADVLEEVYTNPKFPKGAPSLSVSMKASGKSRADLWALASLIAVKHSIDLSNTACTKPIKQTCATTLKGQNATCEVKWPRKLVFKPGRKDCNPDPGALRPYFHSKPEIHPNPSSNGPDTINFFKNNFNMDSREAISLMGGAHSLGRFKKETTIFRYAWTRGQDHFLNNQLFRHLVEKPQFFMICSSRKQWMTSKPIWVGDAKGQIPQTKMMAFGFGWSRSGGPFQWSHQTKRCYLNKRECKRNPTCCPTKKSMRKVPVVCDPKCVQWLSPSENALSAEVGFVKKFDTDPKTGKPTGCPGFGARWRGALVQNDGCPRQDFAPDGESLYDIVERYADDQQAWIKDFIPAMEKMVANGYESLDNGFEV